MGSFAGLAGLIVLHDLINPGGAVLIKGPTAPTDLFELLWLLQGAALCLAVAYVAWFRFGRLEFVDDWIWVQREGRTKRVSWGDVESFMQLPCCTPPVYRLAFKEQGLSPTYFMMSATTYVSVGFWSWDLTGFRSYALRRLKQARAEREAATAGEEN